MKKCNAVTVAAMLLVLSGCGGSSTGTPQAARTPQSSPSSIGGASITVDGVERTYIMFRPKTLDPTRLAPLVLALHGWTSNAVEMERKTGFDQAAESAGFVVVYPQGVSDAWNAGRCCGGDKSDDVGFIKALIGKLVAGGGIDPKRVFVTGMSNGAMMAQRLACEAADSIAAIASVAGDLVIDSCAPSRPISVLEMHGTADGAVPFAGGGLLDFQPIMSNLQRWAALDGCPATSATTQNGITTTYTWAGCSAGSKVMLVAIAGGAHNWFNPESDGLIGEPDATQTVWDFFSRAAEV